MLRGVQIWVSGREQWKKKQNNEITSYRNAKIQEQEKIKNNCERKIER